MSAELDAVRMIGMHLGCGHTHPNVVCPFCHGGSSHDRSFAVSRKANGQLAYICYRASCGESGYVEEGGYRHQQPPQQKKQRKLNPYTDSLLPLKSADYDYFRWRFNLDEETVGKYVRVSADGRRYALAINGILGERHGWVLREPWNGKPKCPRPGAGYRAKTVLYMHDDVEPISVYQGYKGYGPHCSDTLVVVEDQISAMRLWQMNYKAVALLGTHLNMARVRILQRMRAKRVVLALDPDATDKAFEFARTWGLALPNVRVALLEHDIKDYVDDEDIVDILGGH